METTEKIIIYQVLPACLVTRTRPAVQMAALKKTDVEK